MIGVLVESTARGIGEAIPQTAETLAIPSALRVQGRWLAGAISHDPDASQIACGLLIGL